MNGLPTCEVETGLEVALFSGTVHVKFVKPSLTFQ